MKIDQQNAGRLVELSGAHNFRDLGGYQTQDGRSVARQRVYRSGTLARLTKDDLGIIEALGIHTVCDFRSNSERAHRPSRLVPDAGLEIWVHDHEISAADLGSAFSGLDATTEKSYQLMIGVYQNLAYEQAAAFRELFLRLAEGNLPLLFHCSVGKDRTGAAAALLLHVLGVPRPAVIEDYLLTELFFEKSLGIALQDLSAAGMQVATQAIWEPIIRADAAYIEALFNTLETRHGSVEGYVHDVLELNDVLLERVRARLLVDLPVDTN